MRLARVLGAVGRVFIAAGLTILLFVGYQLWGTGVLERRSQDDLTDRFAETQAQVDQGELAQLLQQLSTATTTDNAGDTQPSSPPPPQITREQFELVYPAEGKSLALIEIPKLGVQKIVVEGIGVEDLKKGPGHYPETPLPGQAGNAAIAGHRTTYGAPFARIDELAPGDEITVTSVLGKVTYQVDKAPFIVAPTQVDVLNDFGDNRLTLTACHPKYSARQRIIATAKLVGEPLAVPLRKDATAVVETVTEIPADTIPTETTEPPATTEASPTTVEDAAALDDQTALGEQGSEEGPRENLDEGLGWDRGALTPALTWGAIALAVALAAWGLAAWWARGAAAPWRRKLTVYALVSPLFFFVLFVCFFFVDRLLPAY
ncbi:MAG: class E sortase [Acidimicrobiales bacterium]